MTIGRSAEISPCGQYRYWLRRTWQLLHPDGRIALSKGVCCFVMLNPSTADDSVDDPTIRRCMGFARSWGYDTLDVRNLFALRATDPKELLAATEPTGGYRGYEALLSAGHAELVVVAWGAKVPFGRDQVALNTLRGAFPDKPLHCLGTTMGGHPRHPLYVRAATLPQIFPNRGEIKQ